MFVKGKLKDVNMNYQNKQFKKPVMPKQSDVRVEIKDAEKAGEMSEDDAFTGKEKLQLIVDEYNKKIEELRAKKEVEIMTV